MVPETISFFCPFCGSQLELPSDLAGISGPCPTCSHTIQAPTLKALAMQARYAEAEKTATTPTSPPVTPPTQAGSSQASPSPKPARQIMVRDFSSRTPTPEIVAKLAPPPAKAIPDPEAEPPPEDIPPPRRQDPRRSRSLPRLLTPAAFLTAVAIIVIGTIQLIHRPSFTSPGRETSPPSTAAKPATPNPSTNGKPPDSTPAATENPRETANARALKALEDFLAATTLEQRLPMIETSTAPDQLALTCLASPLPPTRISATHQSSNTAGSVTDCYYRVRFELQGGVSYLQTMLVRVRGLEPPRIAAEPLLDLFGGRLAAYAANPSDQPGYFHVILRALDSRPPDHPNADNQFTVQLFSDDSADECVATAIAEKLSPVGKAIADSAVTGIPWDRHSPCVIMLQWNRDNPLKPYLEALDLRQPDWNE